MVRREGIVCSLVSWRLRASRESFSGYGAAVQIDARASLKSIGELSFRERVRSDNRGCQPVVLRKNRGLQHICYRRLAVLFNLLILNR